MHHHFQFAYIKTVFNQPVSYSLPGFFLITPGVITILYLPMGVVGWRSDYMHCMSLSSKVGGKLTSVFADAGEFGIKVETNDEDLH